MDKCIDFSPSSSSSFFFSLSLFDHTRATASVYASNEADGAIRSSHIPGIRCTSERASERESEPVKDVISARALSIFSLSRSVARFPPPSLLGPASFFFFFSFIETQKNRSPLVLAVLDGCTASHYVSPFFLLLLLLVLFFFSEPLENPQAHGEKKTVRKTKGNTLNTYGGKEKGEKRSHKLVCSS